MIPHVVEGERGDLGGAMTGQSNSIGCHDQIDLSPTAITGLRVGLVVVGQHVGDLHSSPVLLNGLLGHFPRTLDLLPGGHEGRPVLEPPAVVLGIGQLDPVRAEPCSHVNDLADPVQIGAVEHNIDGKGKAQFPDERCRGLLVLDRANPGDLLRDQGI
jgi:hypothetical protein